MAVPRASDLGEPFRRISVDDANALIEQDDVQVVDVRQPAEFAAGHVPGSLLIPLDTLLARSGELDEQREIIFVCAVGQRSAVAAEIAAAVGRQKINNMEGGMVAWEKRGYAIER